MAGTELLRRKKEKSVYGGVQDCSLPKERRRFSLHLFSIFLGISTVSVSLALLKRPMSRHVRRLSTNGVVVCPTAHLGDNFATKSIYMPPESIEPLRSSRRWKLVHVSLIARHGSRYPTKKNVLRLAELHKTLQETRSADSPPWLEDLYNPFHLELAGNLTERGKREMRDLGGRMWALYGELANVNNTRIESTYKPRAQQSALSFAGAWFGATEHSVQLQRELIVHPQVPRDTALRFFECAPYNEFRAETKNQREKQLSHLHGLAERLTKKLRLQRPLVPFMARMALHWCMYDVARGANSSEFCKLFTADEIRDVQRHEQDVESFHVAHAKYPWVAKPLLTDVLKSLRAYAPMGASVTGGPRERTGAHLRFAHAETLVPFVLMLRLGATTDPTETCRSWVASTCPMGANLVLELYEDEQAHSHIVRFRLNERYVEHIGVCKGKDHCSLKELEHFHDHLPATSLWNDRCQGEYVVPKHEDRSWQTRVDDVVEDS